MVFQDQRPIPPPEKTKEDILLFFKFYDPEKGELRYIVISSFLLCFWLFGSLLSLCFVTPNLFHGARYVGRFFVKSSGKPIEILEKLNQMAGFAPDEEIELYEVCVPKNLFVQHVSSFLFWCSMVNHVVQNKILSQYIFYKLWFRK